MRKKKYFIIILTFLTIMAISIFALLESRYFFQFNNRWFTIWNTKNGSYLIFSKYNGLFFPKNNYILFDDRINIIIFVDDENTYHFFSYDCIAGYSPEANLKDISILIHQNKTKESNFAEMKFYENAKFSYFDYYARDNWGHVKENQNRVQEVLTDDLKWTLQRFLLGMLYFNRGIK